MNCSWAWAPERPATTQAVAPLVGPVVSVVVIYGQRWPLSAVQYKREKLLKKLPAGVAVS